VVVVGVGAAKDTEVFGETPNIAARVRAVAVPNSVLITAATHRLVLRLFMVEAHEVQALRRSGLVQPPLWRRLSPITNLVLVLKPFPENWLPHAVAIALATLGNCLKFRLKSGRRVQPIREQSLPGSQPTLFRLAAALI
jgi:hypothetical protein